MKALNSSLDVCVQNCESANEQASTLAPALDQLSENISGRFDQLPSEVNQNLNMVERITPLFSELEESLDQQIIGISASCKSLAESQKTEFDLNKGSLEVLAQKTDLVAKNCSSVSERFEVGFKELNQNFNQNYDMLSKKAAITASRFKELNQRFLDQPLFEKIEKQVDEVHNTLIRVKGLEKIDKIEISLEEVFDSKEVGVTKTPSHICFKNQSSFLLGFNSQGYNLIESGNTVYSTSKFPVDGGSFHSPIYIPDLDCYIFSNVYASDSKLYRKDIDDKPAYLYYDAQVSFSLIGYSNFYQRLIFQQKKSAADPFHIKIMNLSTIEAEVEYELENSKKTFWPRCKLFEENKIFYKMVLSISHIFQLEKLLKMECF